MFSSDALAFDHVSAPTLCRLKVMATKAPHGTIKAPLLRVVSLSLCALLRSTCLWTENSEQLLRCELFRETLKIDALQGKTLLFDVKAFENGALHCSVIHFLHLLRGFALRNIHYGSAHTTECVLILDIERYEPCRASIVEFQLFRFLFCQCCGVDTFLQCASLCVLSRCHRGAESQDEG